MSEPTVTAVKDGDGRMYWFSSDSKMLRDGLADGTYSAVEEANDEAKVPDTGGDLDSGAVDSGPGHGELPAGDTDGGDGAGEDLPKPRRERRQPS